MKRIAFVGAFSGGHLTPIKAVKNALENESSDLEFYLITDVNTKEDEMVENLGVKVERVISGKLRRYFSFSNFIDIFKIIIGFFQALYVLFRIMPNVIFSRGSSVSVPVGIAAWILRIPVMIHEVDISPSLTNKILAPFANKIGVSFDETAKHFKTEKTAAVGVPIRKELLNGNRERALQKWELDTNKVTILVLGGSQGSRVINKTMVGSLPKLLEKYQILLQCGRALFEETKEMVHEMRLGSLVNNLRLFDFLETEDQADALALADLIISRAGGTTLVEIAQLGKSGIFVPLSEDVGRGDQTENAYYFQKNGAAIVLLQNNLTPSFLIKKIDSICQTQQGLDHLKIMGEKASKLVYRDADIKIAQELLKMAKE